MGLADDLARPENPWAQTCQVTKVLELLDPVDAEALRNALANPEVSASFIHRKLKENDYKVAADAIRRHRRGVCCKEVQ